MVLWGGNADARLPIYSHRAFCLWHFDDLLFVPAFDVCGFRLGLEGAVSQLSDQALLD
jgi:hypothetical protein